MQQSLGHAGASRGVKDEQIVFGIHVGRRAIWPLYIDERIHSDILGSHVIRWGRVGALIEAFPYENMRDDLVGKKR